MSNIIESLKAAEAAKTSQELTQEQLAEVYFSGSDKQKRADSPLVIRVVERPRGAGVTPWLVASIALLVASLSLFSTKRLLVDVKIVDDKSFSVSDWQPGTAGPVTHAPGANDWERLPAEDFVFEGAAKIRSSKNASQLSLVNSSVAPFAKASVYFSNPLDLSNSRIVFYARGQRGGENLVVAVKDKDNRLAFHKGKFYPFPDRLTTEWQRAEVPMTGTASDFNARQVTSLRLEFGTKDADNRPGDAITVKDLRLVAQ